MKVLIACEFSGIVRDAFRARGHDAWSCDILDCEADPQYHFKCDVRNILSSDWDLMIAHPPCTHIASSGAAWFKDKIADGRQQQGIDFFMLFANTEIGKVCIENPVGVMSTAYRKPDQIIQPYYFGDEFQKTTCLWLKGLPPLNHTGEDNLFQKKTHVGKGEMVKFESGKIMPKWYAESRMDGKARSKTFAGFADAMADQWG